MKKICIFAVLIITTMFFLMSCGNSVKGSEESSESNNTSNEANDKMSVAEVTDIAEYVIVRPDRSSKELLAAVLSLKSSLEELTGTTIKITSDFGTKATKEILFGETNREATQKALEDLDYDNSYVIRKSGDKI